MKKNVVIGIIISIIIIAIIFYVAQREIFSCSEVYSMIYWIDHKPNNNEEAYSIIMSFINNESIIVEGYDYRGDYLKEQIQSLTINDIKFKNVKYYLEQGKSDRKEMWILDRLAIDDEGTIYGRILCR